MMTRPTPPFLALALVVATILTLISPSAFAQSLPSQAYFLSIDCGATTAYTDPMSGINWVPDTNYTSVGTNMASVPGGTVTANNTEAQTLRYFKDARKKFCYELPVETNQSYLIVATFWYGNYDTLNKPPLFNMAIDATEMLPINLTAAVWETNIKRVEYVKRVGLEQTIMSVCFYQNPTSLTTPFVSSIEMRLLDPIAYDQPWIDDDNFLMLIARQDFGGVTKLRYPNDSYDRVWSPATIPGATPISTTETINDRNLAIKPPQAVLQTAITATSLVLSYPYGSPGNDMQCVYYLYFAEISATATATSREFSVSVPNDTTVNVNIYSLSGGVNNALVTYWTNVSLTDTSAVTLSPTNPPTVDGPLVSGAELLWKYPLLALPTYADDAAALETIKAALLLTGWSGDPCLLVPYDWITCSLGTSPRVLTVNLSGYNLTGPIPVAFAQLTSLTSLQLANNSLSGSIPDSLANLPALTELILTNNNLTGTVPAGLRRPGLALDINGNPVCNCISPSGSPSSPSSGPPSPKPKPKPSNTGVIAGVVGGILGVVLIGVLLFVFCCIRKRNKTITSGSVQGAKPYSFAEVASATQNFNRKIGEGGFGSVYYGKLGDQEVAVKVLDANSRQGVKEFNNEVQLLSRVHHRNLVSLVGYCAETKNQMLVYEFMQRGTVREHLYGSPLAHEEPLDWKMRLDIALNSAQGLEYLHGGCTPNIIHRDVKSSNILLTDKYVAKVADFGISRLGPETGQASHVSTAVVGTLGYLDPDFGVVLLELLCGRKPIDISLEDQSQWSIVEKVRNSLQAGDIDSILDPVVKSCHPNVDSMWKVAEVAIQSVEPKGVHRPFMRDVVRELREAIVLEAGYSHASYTFDQSSSFAKTAPHGQDYSNVADASMNILEYTMPEGR